MRPVLAVTAALLLAGCNDPYQWKAHWDAPQTNLLNQAAQAENWRDLDVGFGDPGSDGQEAAAAVDRLRHGTVKALSQSTISDIAAGSSAAPAPVAGTTGL